MKFNKKKMIKMALRWSILSITSDVYQDARIDSKWLNTNFNKPKTLLSQNQDISSIFIDFSPKVYSTEISWLNVKWKTEISSSELKYRFGKPFSLLQLDKLYHLELLEEEEHQDGLVQLWNTKIAVDSSRRIMKELTLGFHPKERERTLVFSIWAGLPDECFNLHLKMINSGIQIFTNLIVLASLPELNFESREIFKKRFQNSLQSDLPVDYLFEQNNSKLGKVTLFHNLISDSNWKSKFREHFCYIHSKGASHPNDASVKAWIELMYKFCFANWDSMLAHPTAIQGGALKSRFPFPTEPSPNWCYTGAFMWFKSSRVLGEKENLIITDQFGIEKLPGFLDPFGRQSLVFLETIPVLPYDCNRKRLSLFWTQISHFLTQTLPPIIYPSISSERQRISQSYRSTKRTTERKK